MLTLTTHELPCSYEAPFVPFPENPELIWWEGSSAFQYITPEQVYRQLNELVQRIDIDQYDLLAYNLNGGAFPARLFAGTKGFTGKMLQIEYHMAKNGSPVSVVKRIPERFRDKKILVIEDVYDTGSVFNRMQEDCPALNFVVMSLKINVPNQIQPSENVIPLFKTVNKWQAGVGMNINLENDPYYPQDAFRLYPGIVVRPSDEVLTNVRQHL